VRNLSRFTILPFCLTALLAGPATSVAATDTTDTAEPRVVELTAKRFEYSPKEITLKRGEPVTLRIHSEDVAHGLFSKKLKLDADILPKNTTEVTITPEEAGTFTAICNHFCGAGHGGMKLKIVVQP
jgi:cytochrome c oxidase subunit II